MSKKIVFMHPEGHLAIFHPADPEADLVELAKSVVPAGVEYHVVDESEIPTDRTFRGAWVHDGGIKVGMEKAKDIWRDKIREQRRPILESLDVAFIRALETGDTELVGDIRAQKQALRDATDDPVIDAAATPEELKAAIPEVLKIK